MTRDRVLIALSGGVDSSVAAGILINQGYECIGCSMLLHGNNKDEGDAEALSAKRVAERLGIPFVLLDFRSEFKTYVIDKFVNTYLQGMTPNPCVDCNKHLKFGLLYEKAEEMGCHFVATGHYAKIIENNGHYYLAEADYKKKDQTYFLYNLNEKLLSRTLFPLGRMSKEEVREIAENIELHTANKKDSQDICFVPDGDYGKVIEEYIGSHLKSGEFIGPDGEVLGIHRGIAYYTVGQRKGLGIAYKEPLFVKKISADDNRIYLGTKNQIFKGEMVISDINFINEKPSKEFNCLIRTRYHQVLQRCRVYLLEDEKAKIVFDIPQRDLSPGQAAVFYTENQILIGGGTISMV